MPEDLRRFLMTCTGQTAMDIWYWIDGSPDVTAEILETVTDAHNGLHSLKTTSEHKLAVTRLFKL